MFSLADILQIAQWRIQGSPPSLISGSGRPSLLLSKGLVPCSNCQTLSCVLFGCSCCFREKIWLFRPRKMYEVFCDFRPLYQKTELTQLSLGRGPFLLAIECTVDVI